MDARGGGAARLFERAKGLSDEDLTLLFAMRGAAKAKAKANAEALIARGKGRQLTLYNKKGAKRCFWSFTVKTVAAIALVQVYTGSSSEPVLSPTFDTP